MSTDQTTSTAFPTVTAIITDGENGVVTIAGVTRKIKPADFDHSNGPEDLSQISAKIVQLVAAQAKSKGTEITVNTEDPTGKGKLLVSPDGSVRQLEFTAYQDAAGDTETVVPLELPAPTFVGNDTPPVPAADPTPTVDKRTVSSPTNRTVPTPPPSAPAPPTTPPAATTTPEESAPEKTPDDEYRNRLRTTSFLDTTRSVEPATQGFRGWLTSIGIRVAPSAAELSERADVHAVSQHWPGPRTVAVVNRKGGANKTPTVACLSAVFARNGGGGTLAWDNNESQGTLGWRTEQGPHGSSVLDLLNHHDELLGSMANNADLARFVHHQADDKYDVLRSDSNEEGDHEIQADEVARAHAVASKYYRLIVMDSGNTARSANWREMIRRTDQLVIPTTTMADRAEAAKDTLRTLAARDQHSAALAANAVVIISEWDAGDTKIAQEMAEIFKPLVRSVVTVPYDRALKGGLIRFSALQPKTQRAWLAAAAAVARGF